MQRICKRTSALKELYLRWRLHVQAERAMAWRNTKTVPEPLRGKHHVLWLEESPHHVQHGCFTDVHIGLRWALQRCVAGHQEVKSRCRDQRGLRGMTSYSLTRFSTRAVACAGANPPHRHIVLGRSPGKRAKCPPPVSSRPCPRSCQARLLCSLHSIILICTGNQTDQVVVHVTRVPQRGRRRRHHCGYQVVYFVE